MNRIFILTVLALSGCDGPRTSLVERADPAERVRLELSGAAHDALALPFPAERRFEVDLPSAAFLRVSPALVTEQNVRRARVSFRVMVETENDSVEVFDEVFRFGDANRWHSRVVDLSRRCCTARSKSLTSLCRLQSHPAQYVSGIPSAAILLSISHPIRCSTRCLANVRARISGPMIAL